MATSTINKVVQVIAAMMHEKGIRSIEWSFRNTSDAFEAAELLRVITGQERVELEYVNAS